MHKMFSPHKRTITIFFENLKSDNFDKIYSDLVKIDRFVEGANTKFSLPNDAPEEFPRIILNSSDNKISCLIGLKKIEISWIFDVFENNADVIEFASKILENAIGDNKISRIGNIEEFFHEVEDNQEFRFFLKSDFMSNLRNSLDSFSFELTFADTLFDEKVKCNKFFRLVSATRDSDKKKLLVITVDFNTSSEEAISWDIVKFKQFITESTEKLDFKQIAKELIT